MSSTLPRIGANRGKSTEKREFVNFNGVRITPPCLIFQRAYEGKKYEQQFSIQNVSRRRVAVRITAPTSFSYKVKTLKNGNLSPGLSLTRKVIYIHSFASAGSCIFSIYINEERYIYRLRSLITSCKLEISPQQIDFGVIDVGSSSPTQTITLRNDGGRSAKFYMDLNTSDDYTLIVNPAKGLLPSNSSISILISLVAYKEGPARMNLWVKAEQPFMIPIHIEAIIPRLEPLTSAPDCSSCPATTFTLVDFPITYEGLTSMQSIYVRNYSSSVSMFCAMGELDYNIASVQACRQENVNYNMFRINPLHGVFQPKQVRAIHFTFRPTKTNSTDNEQQFYFCTIYVCRVKAKYLTVQDYAELYAPQNSSGTPSKTSCSVSGIFNPSCEMDMPYLIDDQSEQNVQLHDMPLPSSDCVKVYLHGIFEKPSVTIVPNELNLVDLSIGQRETRVLELKNLSENLPIIFVYKKVAFIDLDKTDIYVKAHSSVEVSVYVTPQKLGTVRSHVKFDLVYFDYPKLDENYKLIGKISVPIKMRIKSVNKVHLPQINTGTTPNYVRDVGKFCHELRFNTQVEKPKASMLDYRFAGSASSALIGLPNDTQKSIRPWRSNTKCKSIFTKVSRYVPPTDTDYELTVFDRRIKMEESNYYMNYIRQEGKRQRLSLTSKQCEGDYRISGRGKLLCADMKLPSPESIRPDGDVSAMTEYLPLMLAPAQILNVFIDPTVVRTGPIAAYRKFDFEINIRNNNTNTISVTMNANKFNVIFPEGDHRLVKGRTTTSIPVMYISGGVGYSTVELKLILNSCAYVLVHLIANVYPITLHLNKEVVAFTGGRTQEYIEIINALNTEIGFNWKVNCSNFKIQPLEGIIRSKETLLCCVEYLPNEDGCSTVNVELLCSGKPVQQLKMTVVFTTEKLFFVENTIHFKNMPLNIPVNKKAILKNISAVPQCFSWLNDNEDFNRYLQITPSEGIIHSNSYEVLTVTLKLQNCVQFSTRIKFSITGSKTVELTLKGDVVYPKLVIYPEIIQFKRIPASTFDIVNFTIENVSLAPVNIKFDMGIYPEFAILRYNSLWDTNYVMELDLEAQSATELFLRFVPVDIFKDTFYLPMIINDILGPVVASTGRRVAHFLTEQIPDSTLISVPAMLSIIKVEGRSKKAKFTLSKTFVKLSYARPPNVCIPAYELRVVNVQDETDKFCFRTDDLEPPLHLKHLRGVGVEYGRKSIVCTLDPQEEVFFKVSFKPLNVGTYEASLPMFVKSDNSDQPHNILWIQGTFSCPTITSPTSVMYFESLPLKIHAVVTRRFILKNHFANCRFSFRSQLQYQEIEYINRVPIGRNTEELWVKVHTRPVKNRKEKYAISVSCTCGGVCTVTAYQVMENCYLTNYALTYEIMEQYDKKAMKAAFIETMRKPSLISILETVDAVDDEDDCDILQSLESYPFYPRRDEPLYEFLEACVSSMEKWVYNRGFFKKHMYRIPHGIRCISFQQTEDGRVLCVPPFVQLLINMAGTQIETYLNIKSIKDDEFSQASYIYNLYKNSLNFLTELGASFCCVFPEYLMPYYMYKFYIHHRPKEKAEEEIMNLTDWQNFDRLSKQCWLDVMLQTYKVLLLFRLIRPLEALKPPLNQEGTPHFAYRNSLKNTTTNNHLFSNTELLVLNWLEFHYNQALRTTWADNAFLAERNITYFGECMEDGFIYAAVTLQYCPYLEKHFDGLRQSPKYSEDIIHNNIKVLQAWETLNLNLKLSIDDLIVPHPLHTFLISMYLFESLPHLYPQDKLHFKVGLSKKTSQCLTLKNSNDFPLGYKAILYGDNESFSVKELSYVIQPNAKCAIRISYWAKFIRVSQCILILSAECPGYRRAASKVIELIGEPDVSYPSSTHEIKSELYKFKQIQLLITSPYQMEATYKIQYTSVTCLSVEDARRVPTRLEYRPFTISRCMPVETTLVCNDKGVGQLTLCIFAFDKIAVPAWIYFCNRETGSFLVKILTIVTKSTEQQLLKVQLSQEAVDRKKEAKFLLKVPCQNRIMWNGIVQALQKVAVADVDFWKDVVYTTTGMHILTRLVHFAGPCKRQNICGEVDYTLKIIEKGSKAIMPKFIHLDDQCLCANIIVPLRFTRGSPFENFHFTMTCTDGLETRQYFVVFVQSQQDQITAETQ